MASQPTIARELTNGFDLIAPQPYAEAGTPHGSLTALRRSSPLHYCEVPDYEPFWAVTKHADICAISKRPDVFLNAPGIVHPRTDVPVDRSEASARCARSSRWTRPSTAASARSRARGSRRALSR